MTAFGENDILLGRDKRSHGHAGNRRFRQVIQEFHQEYQEARFRKDKSRITEGVIRLLTDGGGRFLKFNKDKGWYEEVSEADRYEKVSHALRAARCSSKNKKRRNKSPANSISFLKSQEPITKDCVVEQEHEEQLSSNSESHVRISTQEICKSALFQHLLQKQQRLFRTYVREAEHEDAVNEGRSSTDAKSHDILELNASEEDMSKIFDEDMMRILGDMIC